MIDAAIREYLGTCRELSRLCSQNGWIDDDTLNVDVLERGSGRLICAVSFEEIVMEGSGCVAGRIPCYGRVRFQLDAAGQVATMELL